MHAHLAVLAPALNTRGNSTEISRAPVLAKGAAAAREVLRALQHVDEVEDNCLVEALAGVFVALGGADHDGEVRVAVHVCQRPRQARQRYFATAQAEAQARIPLRHFVAPCAKYAQGFPDTERKDGCVEIGTHRTGAC